MSQWTHVNASIRFDGFQGLGLPTEKELGKICKWEDEDTQHWEKSKLPCGSEGSIEYKIIKNTDESSIAAMVVVFYGDLRDYSNKLAILDYFNTIINGNFIRSGILEIEIEFDKVFVYKYNQELRKFKLIYEEKDEITT